jgi:hypothetical protein
MGNNPTSRKALCLGVVSLIGVQLSSNTTEASSCCGKASKEKDTGQKFLILLAKNQKKIQ